MEQTRCPGCMKLKAQQPICEHCGFDETAANLPHQLPIGALLLDQYVVGRVLGQGGFGITYLGWDQNLERPVAIKEYFPTSIVSREVSYSSTISVTTADNDFYSGRDRFLREAQTLAKLQDVPEIARVHNYFSANGTAYIVMEYVDGITLQQYVRQKGGRLAPQETLALLLPLTQALGRVHQAGLIHRDISPDNIMLQNNGAVRLLDFGTARPASNEWGGMATHSTQAVLKFGFAPMEQYQTRGNLGPWTDEYALCATAYYCMTGTVPPEATARIMGEATLAWNTIPGLSAHQAAVLEQGMSLKPENRFQTVEALWNALNAQSAFVPPQPVFPSQFSQVHPSQDVPLPETQPLRQFTPPQSPYTAPVNGPAGPQVPYTAPVNGPPAGPQQVPYTPPASGYTGPQPAPQTPKASKPPKWMIPAAAILVILLLLLLPKQTPKSTLQELPTETAQAPTEPRYYLMMSDICGDDVYSPDEHPVFGSDITREEIYTVTFLNSLENAPASAWDISAAGDHSILAWTGYDAERELYDLYIGAEGYILAPKDCTGLFHGYSSAVSIDFGGLFDTRNVTNMSFMFSNCFDLVSLDVTCFNTSNVTNMESMFSLCSDLTSLDVSNFDTAKVTTMYFMFSHSGYEQLDLSNFDTSNVTEMAGMFCCCDELAFLDLSNFTVSDATHLYLMFDSCDSLTVSNLKAPTVLKNELRNS